MSRFAPLRFRWLALLGVLALLPQAPAATQIEQSEYAQRRALLREALGEGLYIFQGAPAPANDYTLFNQNAVFYYLTGFDEPSARLLMLNDGGKVREVLFYRPGNPARSIWEGYVPTLEEAGRATGMEARPLGEFDAVVDEMLRTYPAALIAEPGPTADALAGDVLARMARVPVRRAGAEGAEGIRIVSPGRAIGRLRAVKSAAEIDLLQRASWITGEAHREAMRAVQPGMNEFEIGALVEYTFGRYGARRPGFATIIGSGPNSTVLHYNDNDRFMEAGDMLVMDIGASFEQYTTDITRTIPVSGKFTPEQRAIYELVLEAQLAAERLAGVEGTPYRALTRAVQVIFAEGLSRLGLIESPDAKLPGGRRSQVGLYFMHGLGHGIGLEVHDAMTPSMQPGTCFTIEPGLYIRPDALERIGMGPEADRLREKLAPAVQRYAEIGVRIEDSYAFTDKGLVRLSEGIPRTVEEIEAIMAEESITDRSRIRDMVEAFRRYRPPPR